MQTPNAAFSDYQNRLASTVGSILKLVKGANTYYYSSIPVHTTDQDIAELLQPDWSVRQNFDFYSKKWGVSMVTVNLLNVREEKTATAAGWQGPSDVLGSIRNADATLYLFCGELAADKSTIATLLGKCVTAFKGKVLEAPKYDGDYLTMRLVDEFSVSDVMLPLNVMADTLKIPLAYGEFSYNTVSQDYSGLGLAKAVPANTQRTSFTISDHVLDAITELHATDKRLDDPVAFVTRTLNVNDSGKGTATGVSIQVDAVLWPTTEDGVDGYDDEPFEQLGVTNVIDRDQTTSVILHNNLTVGSTPTVNPEGILFMTFGEGSFLQEQKGTFKFSQWTTDIGTYTLFTKKIRLYFYSTPDDYEEEQLTMSGAWVDSASFISRPMWHRTIEAAVFTGSGLNDATSGGTFTASIGHKYTIIIGGTGTPDTFSWYKDDDTPITGVGITGSWQTLSEGVQVLFGATTGHTVGDQWVITARSEVSNQPYAIGIYVEGRATDANGTMNFVNVFGLRLKFRYATAASNLDGWWAACKGREYDSWITSHSASGYADGDLIEDPAGIIESLLIDEVGLVIGDIDMDSFDDAENSSVKARINLHSDNEMTAGKAIRQLAEQSTFAFVWTAAGKARLISLDESSPATDRTIPWSHIKDENIKVSKTTRIVDEIEIKSRYMQEYGKYMDLDTVVDATADGVKYSAKWPNIAGTSRSHVAAHLVAAATGIWSNDHILVEFQTVGLTNADLELGDWIELEAASVDPHQLAYGATWSGIKLLIYKIFEQREDSTKIKAVELH